MILTRSPLHVLAFLAGTLAVAGNAGAQATGIIQWGSGFAEHADRGWQASGVMNVAYQVPIAGGVKAEISGTGGWSRSSLGRAAGGTLAEGRLQFSGPARGLALSAGLGRAFPYGPSEGLSRVEARSWSRMAGLDFGFSLRRTGVMAGGSSGARAADQPPGEDSLTGRIGGGGSARRLQDHYTDFNATIGWANNNVELEAGLGRRFGKPVHQYTSWQLQGLYWLTERLALVASAGRVPADVVSGLPTGNYALFSMRISWKDRVAASRISQPARNSSGSRGFQARRAGGGSVALAVWAPSAQRVEVMGSFSDWQPVELLGGEPGWWGAEVPLAPGLYEINVRFDGGAWQVPAGLRAVDDGFGGRVGVFTVEPAT